MLKLKQDKKSSTMLGELEKTALKMTASLCDIRKMSLNCGWYRGAVPVMVCQE